MMVSTEYRFALMSLQAMDILDQEASEDESTRETMSLDRLPSHEANTHLVDKERRYRAILDQAATSDETVQTKWDQWEKNITELTWDEVRSHFSCRNILVNDNHRPT